MRRLLTRLLLRWQPFVLVLALAPASPTRSQSPPEAPVPARPSTRATAQPPPPSPLDVLKAKELSLAGVVYRLEAETLVEREFVVVQDLRRQVEAGMTRLRQFDSQIAQRRQERAQIDTTERSFSYDIPKDQEDRNRIESQRQEERRRVDRARADAQLVEQQISTLTSAQTTLSWQVNQAIADFQTRQQSVQQLYAMLKQRYAELARDPEVKAALAELNRTARPKVVLGPVQDYTHYRNIVASTADETLRLKGLVPDNGRYVLALELKARSQSSAMKTAREKLAKAESAPGKAAAAPDLEGRKKALAAELANADTTARKNQIRSRIDLLDAQIRRARTGTIPSGSTASGRDPRADLLRAVVDLRKTAEAVRRQRETLVDDGEVRDAINELNKGKSASSRVRVATLAEADKAFQLQEEVQEAIGLLAVPLRGGTGRLVVDLSLNDVEARDVIADPATTGLRLPSMLAARAGVAPTSDPTTVTVTLADGRAVTARRAEVRSLRIGSIDLANVPCLVLPPEAGDQPPTLGTKALGTATVHLDPAGATLYLARFAPPPPERP